MDTNDVGQRTGTTAEWAASTLILALGEEGLNTDNEDVRVGDGVSLWANLSSPGREGRATLSSGTVVVANTSITAQSVIQLTAQSLGTVTAPKALAVTARTAGTSFTITSADNTDTSVVGYTITEP